MLILNICKISMERLQIGRAHYTLAEINRNIVFASCLFQKLTV